MPITSFAPELLELFKQAAERKTIIRFNDKKKAHRLRFRLHYLRRELRKHNHELASIANSTTFAITANGDLVCAPADDQFLKSLRDAGIAINFKSENFKNEKQASAVSHEHKGKMAEIPEISEDSSKALEQFFKKSE